MVISQLLIQIIRHTRIEDRLDSLVNQGLHMAVHQLRRETNCIAGNGMLAPQIQLGIGQGRRFHAEAQILKETVPERQQLIHIQAHGDSNRSSRSLAGTVFLQELQLIFINIQALAGVFPGNGLFTPVAANIFSAALKGIYGQTAVVAAQAAGNHTDFMGKFRKLFFRKNGAFFSFSALSVQRRAISPHKPGDIRAHHLNPHLLLESPEDGVV